MIIEGSRKNPLRHTTQEKTNYNIVHMSQVNVYKPEEVVHKQKEVPMEIDKVDPDEIDPSKPYEKIILS